MTIRDVESTTGLTRANIRFYENQGLLSPLRQENNYREYSQEDVEVLLRIKLLRSLGMSLEQIKALQSGAENMIAALDRQIAALAHQQDQLQQSQRVCREMRSDNVTYSTLDARRYLSSLENPPKQYAVAKYEDAEPPVFAPWQRYWARALDSLVYTCILMTAATWIAGGKLPSWGSFLSTVLGIGMMLLLEPLQLRVFGTTLGKWVFGIRVTDLDGRKLSFRDGFWRTMTVLLYGEGLRIPFAELWRCWKSYQTYENNEYLPWEDLSELTVKDTKPLRYVAAVAVAALFFGGSILSMTFAQLPENRSGLTVEAFCENYRKIAKQNDLDSDRFILEDDGTWTKVEQYGVAYVDMSVNYAPLDLTFTTGEDGTVTGVEISEEIPGRQENGWISSRGNQMQLIALSFLMAQEDYSIFASDEKTILTAITDHPFEDFNVTVCGLEFRYDVELMGYWPSSSGFLLEDDSFTGEPSYSMTFTVTKVG